MQWNKQQWVVAGLSWVLTIGVAPGTERAFTYTYEPETFPQGAAEFEQWVTLRTQRSSDVGQDNYNRWEIREEFEYGVTDDYAASLYLNTLATSFRDPATDDVDSEFEFDGVSLENRYMVWNPATHAVGVTLYLEPKYSGEEAELEERIIIGQRWGDWKWALNLVHETEWELDEKTTEGVFEVDLGVTRLLGRHWALGLEARSHNVFPEYETWENTALFVGPVVSYRQENWWATLAVLPQVWGQSLASGPDPDGVNGLELADHERVNIRLIFGIGF